MKKIGIIIFVVAIVIGVFISNFFSIGNSIIKSPFKSSLSFSFGKVKGSGNFASQQREVAEFKKIKVGGIFKVEVVVRKDFGIEIEADDNIIPLIRTEVSKGTLKITHQKRFSSKNPVKIRVSAPDIESLEISGVASVNVTNLDNESLYIETSGASQINLEGKTSELRLEMSGASKIKAENLNASKVNIEGSGASRANVNVSEDIKAELSGASNVRYSGQPKNINKSTSGASSIKQNK
jgi:hypothetical protein